MKISKEIRTGLIIAIGIGLLFWGINYLKGKDFFTSDDIVYAIYPKVDGLAPSNIVSINGLKIGLIKNIKLLPDHSGNILVSMHIKSDYHIPKNSTAEIYSTDILGTKGIRIVMGDTTAELISGDTLTAVIAQDLFAQVSKEVAPVKAKAESLLSSMDSVLLIIREVFNTQTKEQLKKSFNSISSSLQNMESITASLEKEMSNDGKLKTILDNLASITNNFKKNNDAITHLIENFSSISDTLVRANISQTLAHTSKTLEETQTLLSKVNKGEGNLGLLANDEKLYSSLASSAKNLDELLLDLRANPKRYLGFSLISFGGKSKSNSTTEK
ncbi:MAG: hypothetical protein RIQ89_1540 [Bacteroidota bacterium]|jgi:phospholipid/cholesterol/gamma-HCH transport system substrate-binding protein